MTKKVNAAIVSLKVSYYMCIGGMMIRRMMADDVRYGA